MRKGLNRKGNLKMEAVAEPDENKVGMKYFEIFIFAVFLVFGIYHSVIYYGHQPVPNPDFMGFVETGRSLLAFQLPPTLKRAPVLGLLQVGLGRIVGGEHPTLTGAWLVNAIMHPLNLILLWCIGKQIAGKPSPWLVVIMIINPWVIQLSTQPIAEITLLFFFLLTFYFIFRRSNWSYLFASIATMVRYDGAVLILIIFIMDLVRHKGKRERVMVFLYAVMATVPFGLWMLATIINWQNESGGHYLQELGAFGGVKQVSIGYLRMMWHVGFYPLFLPAPGTSKEAAFFLFDISKVLVSITFISGVVYGLCKRQWNIIIMVVFLLLYIVIHVIHSGLGPRMCVPVYWVPLMVSFYGLKGFWRSINGKIKMPKAIIAGLQGIVLAIAIWWGGMVIPYISKLAPISRHSISMPYVAMAVVVLIFIGQRIVYKARYYWRDLSVLAIMFVMIVSNQFVLARVVGNGQHDMEYKYLADWYHSNAKPDERLVCAFSGVLATYMPDREKNFLHISEVKGDSLQEFTENCYNENVTYVAWASREGFRNPDEHVYKLFKLASIAPLVNQRDVGPYKYISTLYSSKSKFINIFRLQKDTSKP